MCNVTSLVDFDLAVESVMFLSGNCGRKVRAVVDRYFYTGVATFPIGLEVSANLCRAARLLYLRRGTVLAQRYIDDNSKWGNINITLDYTLGREAILRVDVQRVPDSVRERQRFLNSVNLALKRVLAMARIELPEEPFEQLTYFDEKFDADVPVDLNRYASQLAAFDATVTGDLSQVEELWDFVIPVAAVLNPQVSERIAQLNADYDHMVEHCLN